MSQIWPVTVLLTSLAKYLQFPMNPRNKVY